VYPSYLLACGLAVDFVYAVYMVIQRSLRPCAETSYTPDSGIVSCDEVLNLSMHTICRADRGAVLHAAVGKVDFPVEHLYANLGALTAAILAARPKGIKGGGE
jgi:hypothetical protein